MVILEKAGLYDGHDGEGGGILDKLATDREVSEILNRSNRIMTISIDAYFRVFI